MRVAIVGAIKNEQWTSHSGYIRAFEELGHIVGLYPVTVKSKDDYENLDLLLAEKDTYDLVLVFGHGQIYDKRLHYKNFKCCVMAEMGDDPQQFANNIKCAELYDVLLTPDMQVLLRYKDAGWPNTFWWTHCYDEAIFKPDENAVIEYDVVTGMKEYGRRVEVLNQIKNQQAFTFFNKVNDNVHEYVKHLRAGKIVFNCSNFGEITRRIFEGLACKQLVLTDYISERTSLYQLFSSGIHFDTYKSDTELLEKIVFYKDHPDDRNAIANNGYEAVQEHSSMTRVSQLLDIYKSLTK